MASGIVTVKVNGSTIIGKAQPASGPNDKSLCLFYGLRYAKSERYRAPVVVPLNAVSGEVDATRRGPSCPVPMAGQGTSEDCLRVNIIRPSGCPEGAKIPVVMYFHGGGFNFGSPLDNNLEVFVARAEKNIMSVSVCYRLGPLGFGPVDSNLGLKDQRAAMEWVRQWIGEFGGDGEDITLMGVSAGAHSAGHHMLNPRALPFRKAILESGSPTARSVLHQTHPRPTSQLATFQKNLGQKNSLDDILNAGIMLWAQEMDSLCWPFQPTITDNDSIIPDMPLKLWRQPNLKDRLPAILTGFCSHEGADFVPSKRPLPTLGAFFRNIIPEIDVDALEAIYPLPTSPASSKQEDDKRQYERLVEAYGHYAYICPVIHTAHIASQTSNKPVYLYEFAALNNEKQRTAGHCAQSSLVRPENSSFAMPEGLSAVSKEMLTRWTKFIAEPDGKLGEDMWPRFETPFGEGNGQGELLVFGEGNDEAGGGTEKAIPVRRRALTEREKEVCRFWWDRMELSQGMGRKGVVEKAW